MAKAAKSTAFPPLMIEVDAALLHGTAGGALFCKSIYYQQFRQIISNINGPTHLQLDGVLLDHLNIPQSEIQKKRFN